MKLWHYIQGFRKGKDAHRLEKESMSDPFLSEALEGYGRTDDDDHTQRIERMRNKVKQRTARKSNYILATGIAASILIMLGVGGYLMTGPNPLPDRVLAIQDSIRELPPAAAPSPAPDQPLALQRKEAPQKTVKPITRKQPSPAIEIHKDVDIIHSEEEDAPVMEEQSLPDTYYSPTTKKHDAPPPPPVQTAKSSGPSIIRGRSSLPVVQQRETIEKNTHKIQGRVIDGEGQPIIGANVSQPGTEIGTITDMDGYFTISSNDNKKIRVDYIGFEPVTLQPDTGKLMLVAMKEDQRSLDEVVVIGYGTQKKRKLTGSAHKIKETESEKPVPLIGKKAYRKYLKENLIPPTDKECQGKKGKVVLAFHIDAQGRPTHIRVVKSLCPSADQEAIRLVNDGPGWSTGDSEVTLDVKFKQHH